MPYVLSRRNEESGRFFLHLAREIWEGGIDYPRRAGRRVKYQWIAFNIFVAVRYQVLTVQGGRESRR